ncbi:Sec-independent protein translocase protein TatB [Paragemmobacter straminiformis]|uniref:Sec-independent protein translocase protein TatB n=1 Tax=Paragemmobacter straminiformis TaxID=2045119 RepID=A0A842I9T1_9RHOB|nr:Sec-independent protein translocase protein TatB [Gemmobacter straminiformis]MBC2836802.1 twin-arginine translocase subunit TatB [Gemmobacter straminiformis]
MLDIGWSELVLIGVVALIFVGPKDLPRMFHALGRVTSKARGMAREFQRAMDDAAKASGLDEVKKDLNGLQTGLKAATNPSSLGINALEDAARKFEKWDPKTVMRPGAAATATAAAAPAAGAAASVVTVGGTEIGPETKALADKRASEAAAARAKAHELQAKAAASASATFAARAKADAEAAAQKAAAESAAAPAPKPRAPRARKAAEPAPEAVAEAAKPAKKPPVRRKKSDA